VGLVTTARAAGLAGLLVVAGALAAPARAGPGPPDPSPGTVSVLDQAGAPVGGPLTGPDAIENAIRRIHDGPLARPDDAAQWSVVIGGGTYGDVAIDEPDLSVRPAAGASVVITGPGATADTAGGCIDVFRGGVVIEGIDCRAPSAFGIQVSAAPGRGGVILRGVSVERPGTTGIAVVLADAVTIEGATVSDAGTDGIRLSALAGPGPYLVTDSRVRGSGDDGIDVAAAAHGVTIQRTVAAGNGGNGIEADDGPVALSVTGAALTGNAGDGIRLGGGEGVALSDSIATGNGGAGLDLLGGSGYTVTGDRFDGTNRQGDLRFSADVRASGVYGDLTLGHADLTLPGEPRSVVLAAPAASQLSSGSPVPVGLAAVAGFVRMRATPPASDSRATLRFLVDPARLAAFRPAALGVYQDVRRGARVGWLPVPGSRTDPAGAIEAAIGQARIGGASPTRFATYAPLGVRIGTPLLGSLVPAPGATVHGRLLTIRARVAGGGRLTSRSLTLWIDGRRRGGVRLRGGRVSARLPRLTLGRHVARLRVMGTGGLAALREWTFQVGNGRPVIVVARARPGPGSSVASGGPVRFSIPARDDEPVRRRRVRLLVDGRPVRVEVSGGRVSGVAQLGPGIHRLDLTVRDRNGAAARAAWSFRVR
jgi:Right handed beta helix region